MHPSHITINSRYQIEEHIGSGAMGSVYRTHDRLEDRAVALKRVTVAGDVLRFASQSDYSDPRVALMQEFAVLASLRHPNIVSVLDYGFDDAQQPFFTMELLEDANNLLSATHKKSVEEKIALLVQLLEALNYLHRREILHRDLKPANVVVINGQVKLLDFGLAVAQGTSGEDPNLVAGTIAYLPPEILDGAPASVASDLYAVGMIAYQLFAGEHPFNLGSINLLMLDIFNTIPPVADLPISAAMQDVIATLIAKDPYDRYPSATGALEAIAAATDQLRIGETEAIRDSYLQAARFVGRDSEFAQLTEAYEAVRNGESRFVLLAGESGVGKSRLVNEFRVQALVDGALVLRGQSVAEGGLLLQAWRNPIRRLILSVPLTDQQAGILRDIVPDIDHLLGREIPPVPTMSGPLFLQRLVQTVVEVFQVFDARLLLILEDLHWAAESLAPFKQMLTIMDQMDHLMIIATYRSDERPGLPDELPGSGVIPLARLDGPAVAELSASMLGAVGRDDDLVQLLQRETEGNALFMVEIVRALADEAGRLGSVSMDRMPQTILTSGIQDLLDRRLNRLAAPYRSLLNFAAIAGRRIDRAVLGQMTADIEINEWLYACNDVAILEVQDDQWQFNHDKLRETVIAGLSEDQRSLLHRQVAEAIESVYTDDASYNEILLEHWYQAGDLDRETHYLNPVAEQLIVMTADFETARHMLDRALQTLPADDPRRVSLWGLHGRADQIQGETDRGETYAHQALSLAEQIGDEAGIANSLGLLGDFRADQGYVEQATELYQQSLTIYQSLDDQAGVARMLSRLGQSEWEQGRFEQGRALTQEALIMYESLGDMMGASGCYNDLGNLAADEGHYEQARAYYLESLARYEELGTQTRMQITYQNLGRIAYELADYDGAVAYSEKALSVAQAIGDRSVTGDLLNNLGLTVLNQQRFEDARDYLRQALAIREAIGDRSGIAQCYTNLGIIDYVAGEYARARELLLGSLDIKREMGEQYRIIYSLNYLGYTYLKLGDAQARPHFHEALTISREINATSLVLMSLVGAAALHLQEGDPDRAAVLVGLIRHHPTLNSNVEERLNDLIEEMDTDMLHEAIERGQSLDLDAVVPVELDYLSTP